MRNTIFGIIFLMIVFGGLFLAITSPGIITISCAIINVAVASTWFSFTLFKGRKL